MTIQSLLQSDQQREFLLAQHGEVASDATKVQNSGPTAKTAGGFLLSFERTNITFGLRVIKGHTGSA